MEEITRKLYTQQANTYEKRWSKYLQATHQQALQATKLPRKAHVLDLSAGTGLFSKQLRKHYPEVRIDLLDASKDMLRIARKRFNKDQQTTICEADATNIPASNDTYDAIYLLSALQHYKQPQQVLKEARRTLKEEGKLILVAWTKTTWWSKLVYALLQLHPTHHTIPQPSN